MTVLKHKNIIICWQIFRKHDKFTYFFLQKNNASASSSALKVRSVSECFCFGLCVHLQYFDTPGCQLAENSVLQPWKPGNKVVRGCRFLPDLKSLGIHTNSSTDRGKINTEYLATRVSIESEEGERGSNYVQPIFRLWTAVPIYNH